MPRKKNVRALIPIFIIIIAAGSYSVMSSRKTNDTTEPAPIAEQPAPEPEEPREPVEPLPEPAAVATTGSVLSSDSIPIYYDVYGDGNRALVFIHGWGCDRTYWNNQIDEFSRDYKVVTIDLPGHGQSVGQRDDWSMFAFGADVAAVVNSLGLDSVILIGHSMGGTVMIEAARPLATRVRALIGVDNLQNLKKTFSDETIAQYMANYEDDFEGVTYNFTKGLFSPNTDTSIANQIARKVASTPKDIALGTLEQLFRYNYAKALMYVRLPVRCINSDYYKTSIATNKNIAQSFEVYIMSGAGHYPHITSPAKFNEQLHNWINEFWPVGLTADPS